jgi:hypothetical protein
VKPLLVKTPDDYIRTTEPKGNAVLIRRIRPEPLKSSARGKPQHARRRSGEHDEQRALIQWATLNERNIPALRNLFAIPNGGDRHFAVAAKLKAEGVKAGTFDLMLATVVREAGVITKPGLFIEMKWGKGKPTPEQMAFKNRMVAEGYACRVCWTWRDAVNVILDYLGPQFARFKVH